MRTMHNSNDLTAFGRWLQSWTNPPWSFALVTLPWVLGATLLVMQVHRDRARAKREQTTQGIITGHDPGNHDSYEYTFSVGGRMFRAWQMPAYVEWHMGQQVVVYYDPLDPNESSLVEFGELAADDAGPIPALLLGVIGIIAYVGYQRYHHARARPAN